MDEQNTNYGTTPDVNANTNYGTAPDMNTGYQYTNPNPQQTYTYDYVQQPVTPATNGKIGFAIASMCCGIASILCCCAWYLAIVLVICAIVFGIIALKNKYDGRGMAIAGLICGGIGFLLFLFLIFCLALGLMSDYTSYYY